MKNFDWEDFAPYVILVLIFSLLTVLFLFLLGLISYKGLLIMLAGFCAGVALGAATRAIVTMFSKFKNNSKK